MAHERREGPQVVGLCLGCRHYQSTPYRVQGDSGYDRRCLAAQRDFPDSYGDQRTPDWCPHPSTLAAARIALRERDAVAQALNAPWYDDEELTQISKGALRRLRDERDALRERLATAEAALTSEEIRVSQLVGERDALRERLAAAYRWAAEQVRAEQDDMRDTDDRRAMAHLADRIAAGPTPRLAVAAACDCRAAVEGLLHTIRNEDRQPSESYCAALSDVIDMLTTGAMPFTCPHCGFVHYDERQRIVCNNCGEPPNKGGCDDGQ